MIKQSFPQTKNGFYQNVNAALNRGYLRTYQEQIAKLMTINKVCFILELIFLKQQT